MDTNTDKDDAIQELATAVAGLDLTGSETATLIWAGNTWEPTSVRNLAKVIRRARGMSVFPTYKRR